MNFRFPMALCLAAFVGYGCPSDDDDSTTKPPFDTGVQPDTGTNPDTGVQPDTGVTDAGMPDTGTPDTGVGCVEDDRSPNHSAAAASPVNVGDDLLSLQICSMVDDWYSLTLAADERAAVEITFSNATGDLDLYVFAPGDLANPIAASESIEDEEEVSFEASVAGDYLIQVLGFDGAEAPYAMSIFEGCVLDADCTAPALCDRRSNTCGTYTEPNCGADGANDPNGTDSQAISVDLSGGTASVAGLLGCSEDIDFFTFDVAAGDSLQVQVISADANATFGRFLMNSEGQLFAGDNNTDATLTAAHLEAGTWYLIVLLFEPTTDTGYTVDFALTAGGCTGNADCANSITGSFCQADGSCQPLDGMGMVPLGGACDDNADCDMNADFCFNQSTSPDGYFCDINCTMDAECTAVGATAYCSEDRGACFMPCGGNDDLCFTEDFCDTNDECVPGNCFLGAGCGGRMDLDCLYERGTIGGLCGAFAAPACGQGDAGEPNDTASLARAITLDGAGAFSETGLTICDDDVDVYSVTLAEAGNLQVTLTVADMTDIDVLVVPAADQRPSSFALTEDNPEVTTAGYLAPGTYLIWVVPWTTAVAEPSYDLSVQFTAASCVDDTTCEDNTQPLRLTCDTTGGACVDFDGGGNQAIGDNCDDDDDCVANSDICLIGAPMGQALQHFCSVFCQADADCATAGLTNHFCADIGLNNGSGACVSN